jgi:hypothetical protein
VKEPILEPDVWERLRAILAERVPWGRRVVLHVDPDNRVQSVESWRVDSGEATLDSKGRIRVAR